MELKEAVVLDVREDLRLKKEPFDKIMAAVKSIEVGQELILHAPFNPLPLHKVLHRKGFAHQVEKVEKRHWIVTYVKKGATK
ncbi:DUF2249 domain-containing protein [Virgibacillus halodenitrificans]|uniref:DUF2249 domain-containing protein n=1 Tax=Virgibacillus halodenitrificans TaxID=1482 RepID=UPI00031EB5A2|nr:DUF2249 domain-containing protein [Virgibacillus halodenitrificans]